jgi:hypothetical protein
MAHFSNEFKKKKKRKFLELSYIAGESGYRSNTLENLLAVVLWFSRGTEPEEYIYFNTEI